MPAPNFTTKYNTILTPDEERQFVQWVVQNKRGGDMYDYDLRGAWRELNSGAMSADERGHLGDKYKKPNHPTFSDQSIYSGVDGYQGGKWEQLPSGSWSFTPTNTSLWAPQELQEYFSRAEQGNTLVMPPEWLGAMMNGMGLK